MQRGELLLILVLVAFTAYKVMQPKRPKSAGYKTNGAPIIRGQNRL